MSDVYEGSVLGFSDVTEVIIAAAQTQIAAEFAKLEAVFAAQTPSNSTAGTKPDFDRIHPDTKARLLAELTALKTAIANAATT